MKIYRLLPSEDASILEPEDVSLFGLLSRLDEQDAKNWLAPQLSIARGEQTDLAHLSSIFPVWRHDVVDSVADLIGTAAIRLPLFVDGDDNYTGLYVSNVLDCLDVETSDVGYFDDGRVMRIDRFEFDAAKLAGQHIFRLASVPKSEVFFSEALCDRLTSAGYTGFELTELWASA